MSAISDEVLMANAVAKRRPRESSEPMARPPRGKPVNKDLLPLLPMQRAFVHSLLGNARGDPVQAARDAGYTNPACGVGLLKRPQVRRAVAVELEKAEARTGVDMDKDRLLRELDHAMSQAREAFGKTITATVGCPSCQKKFQATLSAGPKEIAALTTATARAVETTAKIIGALAPTEAHHVHEYQVSGSYAEILRMLVERPGMFTPAQQAQIGEVAATERTEIDAVLGHLALPASTTP